MRSHACLVVAACAALSAPALAQPRTADEWFAEGETQYTLRNFERAVEAFKQGFQLETNPRKKAAYLYDIAQAYRQANACREGAFFYKRYLAYRDQYVTIPLEPERRAEVDQRIAELDACAKQASAIASKPPITLPPVIVDDRPGDLAATTPTPRGRPRIAARLTGGGAKLVARGLDTAVASAFAVTAGHPLQLDDTVALELGGTLAVTPLAFASTAGQQRASLTSILADGAMTYAVTPKLALRGELGLGVLLLGGVMAMDNPFTSSAASGPLAMLTTRAALSADYAFGARLFATVSPLTITVTPGHSGLRDDIGAIAQLAVLVGFGYRR